MLYSIWIEMGGSSYIIRFTILPPVTEFYHVYPFVCLINCLDQCVLVLFGLTTPVGLDLTVQTSLVDDLETSQHAQIWHVSKNVGPKLGFLEFYHAVGKTLNTSLAPSSLNRPQILIDPDIECRPTIRYQLHAADLLQRIHLDFSPAPVFLPPPTAVAEFSFSAGCRNINHGPKTWETNGTYIFWDTYLAQI